MRKCFIYFGVVPYLVNLRFVDSMHGDDLVVGGDLLRISRGKKQEFLSAFTRYIGGLSK